MNSQPASLDLSINRFDSLYNELGMRSQRTYPNEAMITFIAQNWFSTPFMDRKGIRILEVGCGSGANLWMLAKEGFSVFGLDSSSSGLQLASSHLHGKWGVEATLSVGSVTDLPYEDGYFDAVIDVVTLQHLNLDDSNRALSEIRRVLRPQGKFFSYRLSDRSVMFLNSEGKWLDGVTLDNIANPRMPLHNCGPTSFWSPSLANSYYTANGLVIDSIECYGRTYGSGSHHVEYLGITATNP